MDLATHILLELIESDNTSIKLRISDEVKKIFDNACYQALEKIRDLVIDNTLSDFACIEQIVCIFEQLGSDGGDRHDFG